MDRLVFDRCVAGVSTYNLLHLHLRCNGIYKLGLICSMSALSSFQQLFNLVLISHFFFGGGGATSHLPPVCAANLPLPTICRVNLPPPPHTIFLGPNSYFLPRPQVCLRTSAFIYFLFCHQIVFVQNQFAHHTCPLLCLLK